MLDAASDPPVQCTMAGMHASSGQPEAAPLQQLLHLARGFDRAMVDKMEQAQSALELKLRGTEVS